MGSWRVDTTEQLYFHFSFSCIGEGKGNPLQYSCLENPRDRGAWWAAIYGVAQSWTWLKWLSSSSSKELGSHKLHVAAKLTNKQKSLKKLKVCLGDSLKHKSRKLKGSCPIIVSAEAQGTEGFIWVSFCFVSSFDHFFLDSMYKGCHTVFLLLRLTYFTQYDTL